MFAKTTTRHTACNVRYSHRADRTDFRVIMRKTVFINLLIASLIFPGCSDRSATIITDRIGPDTPINEPDTGVFNPTGPVADEVTTEPGEPQPGPSGSPQSGLKQVAGSDQGPNPGDEDQDDNTDGGQPVPEPGTLLLFGSGVAGIGASLLHRRRRQDGDKPATE